MLNSNMLLGFKFFENLLSKSGTTLANVAEKLSITPQALQTWKASNRIPAKRVSQLIEVLGLSPQQVDQLLGVEPLLVDFRTRNKHSESGTVSEHVKVRAETVYERFIEQNKCTLTYDLSRLRREIGQVDGDFQKIANCIRSEFTIPNYRPLGSDDLFALQNRIGVQALYLPFKQIGLTVDGEPRQTAILYCRDGCYLILIDSDRTIDEAHFDRAHEFLHIVFDSVIAPSPELEKLIDKVAGELIYPKAFIVEQFFGNDPDSKPIQNKPLLKARFIEHTRNLRHILSPRGLALAARDAELTSRNSELFKFLYSEFHNEFREHAVTYSSYGQMNFDFSDRERLFAFYKDVVDKIEYAGFYPLFTKLKSDLMSDSIQPADFADTFKLKLSDAIILKAQWEEGTG